MRLVYPISRNIAFIQFAEAVDMMAVVDIQHLIKVRTCGGFEGLPLLPVGTF